MFARVKAILSSIILFFMGLFLIFASAYCIKSFMNYKTTDIPIYRVSTNEKKIALTFDISYSERNLSTILSILDKYEVKATFFVVGSWVDENPELVEAIYQRGHEIGNHSNTHPYLNQISKEDFKKELEITSNKIKEITGKETDLFRPPFGEISPSYTKLCNSLGYKVVKWDVDSMDWKNIGEINIINRVAKNTSKGSIILFHGDGLNVNYYLEQVVQYFKKSKYQMVKVSDLIYHDNYYIDASGTQKLYE